jgi:hypothetical protein
MSFPAFSQERYGKSDTLLMGAVVEGTDTIPMVYLPEFEKLDRLPQRLARKRIEWNRLRANVYKVYPYAVIAGELFKDVDANLAKIGDDRKARKAYLNNLEKELNKRFKGELTNFTITQGQILVKLISRQTGHPCFHIIKEFKGGFNAFVFQSVALLFNNNLKREYDPTDRDKDIEDIVRELETANYYRYQNRVQQLRAGT